MSTTTPTKAEFIEVYRAHLVTHYDWARNHDKLSRYLDSVRGTLDGPRATWNHDGEMVTATWRTIGGKGKPTLKALRALA